MIEPNLATMLVFILTDLAAPRAAHRAIPPVSVAKPSVTAKPTSSDVAFQPVLSSERIESNT